jgi:glutathione S-transferase
MPLHLYSHPFASYCWKALIALYENETPFEYKMLGPEERYNFEMLRKLSPLGKFPLLVDGNRAVFEATIIIEYVMRHYPGKLKLIPSDHDEALDVRMLDRFFDNYIHTPMQEIVADFIRPPEQRDATNVSEAKSMLDKAYAWLEGHMREREWAAGSFSLADCAAAPALFYADWVHPIPEQLGAVRAYRARLLTRPSVARAVDEARPYRHFFPPGAPDRD